MLATKLEALAHKSANLSEPAIGYLLSQHLSDDIGLFLGNSMSVRFCDRFAIGNQLPAAISANRGVSGIDGTIATAAGYCAGLEATTVCLLGDISFIHDISSLSLLRNMSKPMILIVVNNSGGGIFHHLPISDQDDVFEEFFVTPHTYQFKHAAQQFEIPYSRAATNGEFIEQLHTAIASNAHALIELTVDQRSNMEVWRGFQTAPSKTDTWTEG
jgi:2-succinyl-5-enolpyruvyl-6-hydroxy-3-cyclohexene-1-carboxylate synthase